ncbi:MAG TPA: tetratricopeptide repeat protein [Melioribacteraceae bacterium]|nr:tetratricopeptide repeat protein [Melioribacteraceae bacterium]
MRHCAKILFTLLLITSFAFAQVRSDGLRRQADLLIKEGRFKEAIDQLNKFISANPQLADGYHIRGLCYEKTTEYQYSVLDLRRARRLDPSNGQIQTDLNRVISIWHAQLYRKIEGHKRDIAIDPNYAFSYLEIGKSYRWLEEWSNAELWYDEYLKRDDNASPDEIIRYTEILAKTGSIVKGERILKKFVERYPEDWRLWSRYGYFTLWLSKFKIAEDAFRKALSFKPFFKEAEDGLDQAINQAYLLQYQPRAYEKVYPIDRYTSILTRDPENIQIRYQLVNELIGAGRYEEAYQQLQVLQNTEADNDEFKNLLNTVTTYRDSTYNNAVSFYTEMLKNNPSDKEAVKKLSEAYANLFYFDSAIEILNEYLENVPEDQDLDIRFLFAKYCAWNYEWERAIGQLSKLLQYEPNNLDYKLLRGQIAVWTVLDFDIAENYLLNVAQNRPNEIHSYLSLASMYSWQKKFEEARKYIDIAKSISPNDPEVELAESNYAIHLSAHEEQLVFEIKSDAGKLAGEGNCEEARLKYEEYFSRRTAPTRDELIEYAEIVSCTRDFQKAIEIYDQLLNQEFDYKVALHRARNYYYNKDSTLALAELESLYKLKPEDEDLKLFLADAYAATDQPEKAEAIYRELMLDNQNETEVKELNKRLALLGEYYIRNKKLEEADELYEELLELPDNEYLREDIDLRRMYLADAYVLNEEYGRAEDIYEELLETTTDTSEVRILNQRISWIPPSGFSRGISSIGNFLYGFIPTNIGITPFSNYYADNQNLKLWNYGLRLDAGLMGFFGLGAQWNRTNIKTDILSRDFTTLKGILSIYLFQNLTISAGYGTLNILGEPTKNVGDITLRYEKPDYFSLVANYENNDARLLLYSPTLIYVRLKSELYRLTGYYQFKDLMKISGYYSYYQISDNNEGNDLQLRFGRKFFKDALFGYEYFFSDFAFVATTYYSPQDFDSHSIWGEYSWQLESKLKGKFGGKIGYVPMADFIISEIYAEASYKPIDLLIISGRLGFSNSFRYDTGYRSFSASLSAYWSIY